MATISKATLTGYSTNTWTAVKDNTSGQTVMCVGLSLTNRNASGTATVDVRIVNASNVEQHYITVGKAIGPNSSVESLSKFVLEAGDTLPIRSDASGISAYVTTVTGV